MNRINKAKQHFTKIFKNRIKENRNVPGGYYTKGDSSEVLMYFSVYVFLIITMPNISYYVLENSKKN